MNNGGNLGSDGEQTTAENLAEADGTYRDMQRLIRANIREVEEKWMELRCESFILCSMLRHNYIKFTITDYESRIIKKERSFLIIRLS